MSLGNGTSFLQSETPQCTINYKTLSNDRTIQITASVINALASSTAITANLLILMSIFKTPSLRSPSNTLLLGLALSDFCVGLMVQPVLQANLISQAQGLSQLYCTTMFAQSFLGFSLCGVSMATLTLITLDRYAALYFHLRYQQKVTTERVVAGLVIVWLFMWTAASTILWSGFEFANHLSVVVTVTTFTTTVITYCLIYRVVRRHAISIDSQMWAHTGPRRRRELSMPHLKKSSFGTFIICFAFMLCFLPYSIIRTIMNVKETSGTMRSLYDLAILLVFCNSAINPLLCCWRFRTIRVAVIRTAKGIFSRRSNN